MGRAKSFVDTALGQTILALVRGRWILLMGLVLGALVAAGITHFLKPVYRAQARVLPPQVSSNVASNLMLLVGGSGDFAASAAGQKNPSELYVGILRSRSVLLPVIETNNLVKHYKAGSVDDAEQRLMANLATTLGKEGIIAVEVSDRDPELAATLCNAVIEEMYVVSRRLAADERQRRDHFYAPWLADARARLVQAEEKVKRAELRTGLSKIKGQEESLVLSASELRSQITSMSAVVQSMRAYATNDNPELQRMEAQLGSLRARLAQMSQQSDKGGENALQVPLASANEIADEVGRLRRDAKLQESLLEIVSRLAELSKVDETRDLSLIKVLDKAIAPTKPVSPRVTINVFLGAGTGLFLAFFFVLVRHQTSNPGTREFWRELRESLRQKRP